ncbi:AraC family transcriptional regulator [Candidatus Soleaferrea massiliensis]|uniref:AraC family transcriptional regulator n=1 Tax=Candidatus Soleaferrea massiliensis TaxID=1470354 RepID=UPI00058B53D1|nr:AraC family transcriptional regulator [Candidatus Soleaferrea massiliensis]
MNNDTFKYSYKSQFRENLSLTVYNTGIEQCENGFVCGPRVRDHFLVHYILSGKGTYTYGDNTYELAKGDLFIIYPSEVTIYKADDELPWEYCWVGFNGTEAEKLLRCTDLTPENPVLHYDRDGKMRDHLFKIYKSQGNQLQNESRMTGYLYLFLSFLMEISTKQQDRDISGISYIEAAVKYVQHNFSRDIDVCDIAQNIGVSRSHLYRLFIKHLGMPPNEYLSRFRINQACSLLRHSDLSIGEIANSVGFLDQLYFSRVFKKFKGTPPSKYNRR